MNSKLCKQIRRQSKTVLVEWFKTLVSEKEADLKAGKISYESPIGKGLLNKKIGEIAEVTAPAGIMQFEILDITLE